MDSIYNFLLNWSEVWPLAIPLIIYFVFKPEDQGLKPVIIYIAISLLLGLLSTIISLYTYSLPKSIQNNGCLYNINAILKVLILGYGLARTNALRKFHYLKWVIAIYLIFITAYFLLYKSIFNFSSELFAATSIVILTICLTFFLNAILDDQENIGIEMPLFLICAGIFIYESINFFIYLFMFHLYSSNVKFSLITMDIIHYTYISSYIIISIAIYKAHTRNTLSKKTLLSQ